MQILGHGAARPEVAHHDPAGVAGREGGDGVGRVEVRVTQHRRVEACAAEEGDRGGGRDAHDGEGAGARVAGVAQLLREGDGRLAGGGEEDDGRVREVGVCGRPGLVGGTGGVDGRGGDGGREGQAVEEVCAFPQDAEQGVPGEAVEDLGGEGGGGGGGVGRDVAVVEGQDLGSVRTRFDPVAWCRGGLELQVGGQRGEREVASQKGAGGDGGGGAFEDGAVAPSRDDAVDAAVVVGGWEVGGDGVGVPPMEHGPADGVG